MGKARCMDSKKKNQKHKRRVPRWEGGECSTHSSQAWKGERYPRHSHPGVLGWELRCTPTVGAACGRQQHGAGGTQSPMRLLSKERIPFDAHGSVVEHCDGSLDAAPCQTGMVVESDLEVCGRVGKVCLFGGMNRNKWTGR